MTAKSLLGVSRQDRLAVLLRKHGELRLRDVISEFGVARATAQRDLELLATLPWVMRTHGGVVAHDNAAEASAHPVIRFEDRQQVTPDAKKRIAQAAVKLLQDSAALYIDAGTTTLAVTQELIHAAWRPTWVVTNDWHVAELLSRARIRHELLGGEVDPGSLAISGLTALNTLSAYRFDWALLAADAVTAAGSVRVARPPEAFLKRAAGQASTRRLLLAHAEKFGCDSYCEVAPLAEYTTWITDRADEAIENVCASSGVQLIVA